MFDKFYTPKQVAEILQIHPYTVLKWIREGKLTAHKFGRVYRTSETDLTAFLGMLRPSGHIGQPVQQSLEAVPQRDAEISTPGKSAEYYDLPLTTMSEQEHQLQEMSQDHYIL
jgi:excisionase family DNA binding protein